MKETMKLSEFLKQEGAYDEFIDEIFNNKRHRSRYYYNEKRTVESEPINIAMNWSLTASGHGYWGILNDKSRALRIIDDIRPRLFRPQLPLVV